MPAARGLSRLRDGPGGSRWQLWRQRFDVAIDLHGGPRSAWLTWASRAPTRIGYAIKGRQLDVHHGGGRGRPISRRATRS